jgi:hypothetical protein
MYTDLVETIIKAESSKIGLSLVFLVSLFLLCILDFEAALLEEL